MQKQSSIADVVRNIGIMMHDEPTIQMAVRTLQSHCLLGGLQLRFGGATPPTPSFSQHLRRYFLPFCRDAIQSFLTVGFAAYRIRFNEKGARIPEILPFGTFTWQVARSNQGLNATPWCEIGKAPSESSQKQDDKVDNQPLLRYVVHCSHCKEKIEVYPYTPPTNLFSCSSPISSLVNSYLQLCHKRDCANRATLFNSQPGLVFEEQDKLNANTIAESGAGLQHRQQEYRNSARGDRYYQGERQNLFYDVIDGGRVKSNIPDETVTIIAPKNQSVHSIDRVLSPQDMLSEELAFARLVGMALGVPCGLILQSANAVGGGSGGGGQGFAEGAEIQNRMLLDTCRQINQHLEILMMDVYKAIYGSENRPSIRFPLIPTIAFEQLVAAHDSQFVDDLVVSNVLGATWGCTLGPESKAARAEKRKAEYDLPFRDKKETPASSKSKK